MKCFNKGDKHTQISAVATHNCIRAEVGHFGAWRFVVWSVLSLRTTASEQKLAILGAERGYNGIKDCGTMWQEVLHTYVMCQECPAIYMGMDEQAVKAKVTNTHRSVLSSHTTASEQKLAILGLWRFAVAQCVKRCYIPMKISVIHLKQKSFPEQMCIILEYSNCTIHLLQLQYIEVVLGESFVICAMF